MIITTQKLNNIEEKITNIQTQNIYFFNGQNFTYNQLKEQADLGKIIIARAIMPISSSYPSVGQLTIYTMCTTLQKTGVENDEEYYNIVFTAPGVSNSTEEFHPESPTESLNFFE